MMKKIGMAVVAVLFLASCASVIPADKYIGAMVALGCGNALENSPEGIKLLKEQGVTEDQIMTFRKKMDPKKVVEITTTIATKVAECHGVKLN